MNDPVIPPDNSQGPMDPDGSVSGEASQGEASHHGDGFTQDFWNALESPTSREQSLTPDRADRYAQLALNITPRSTCRPGLEADLMYAVPEKFDRDFKSITALGQVHGTMDVVRIAVRQPDGKSTRLLNPLLFNDLFDQAIGGSSPRGQGADKFTAVRTEVEGIPVGAVTEKVGAKVDLILKQSEPGSASYEPHFQYLDGPIPLTVFNELKSAIREAIELRKPEHSDEGGDSEDAGVAALKMGSRRRSSASDSTDPIIFTASSRVGERTHFSHAKLVLDRVVLGELANRGVSTNQDAEPFYTGCSVTPDGSVSVSFRVPPQGETDRGHEKIRLGNLQLQLELDENRFLRARITEIGEDYVDYN